MNREILFRGKRIDNGEWVFGNYYESGISGVYILTNKTRKTINAKTREITLRDEPIPNEVDPSTVCEYTGLTDKNGTTIFEGDIARGKYGSTVYQNEVIFAGDGFALRHSYDQYGYCASLEEHEGLEVIGNIFDHPELLEENNT